MIEQARRYLWLFCCEGFSGIFEIFGNGLQHRIAILHNNCSIEPVPLNSRVGCAYSEASWFGIFIKPTKEQTVALSLTTITIIANVKQYVKVLCKKLINYCQDSVLYVWVVWRALVFNLLNDKLKSWTASQRLIVIKINGVMDTLRRNKIIAAILSNCYLVWRLLVQSIKRELNHNETIVPVNPSRLQRSSKRFSAARFTSKECLKRAKASSYVIFLISIMPYILSALQR